MFVYLAIFALVALAEDPVKDSGTALVAAVDQKNWDYTKKQLEVVEPWAQIPEKVETLRTQMNKVLTEYATKHDVSDTNSKVSDLKDLESKDNNAAVARLAALEALDIDKVRTQLKQSVATLKQDTLTSVKRLSTDILNNHKKNQKDIAVEKEVAANALKLDKTLLTKLIEKNHQHALEKIQTLSDRIDRRLDSLTPKGMRATAITPVKEVGASMFGVESGYKFGFLLLVAFNAGMAVMFFKNNARYKTPSRAPLLP